MKTCVLMTSSSKRARVVVSMGERVVMRATLPPMEPMLHPRAVTMLLEALSLWVDERLCVALSAEDPGSWFHCGLIDEMDSSVPTVAYEIELVKRQPRRARAGESR